MQALLKCDIVMLSTLLNVIELNPFDVSEVLAMR